MFTAKYIFVLGTQSMILYMAIGHGSFTVCVSRHGSLVKCVSRRSKISLRFKQKQLEWCICFPLAILISKSTVNEILNHHHSIHVMRSYMTGFRNCAGFWCRDTNLIILHPFPWKWLFANGSSMKRFHCQAYRQTTIITYSWCTMGVEFQVCLLNLSLLQGTSGLD